ncbi:MAG TPA: radical SAM protein [Bacteroidota bacterium]|nr:radical SAM protein [Bacteroidota bacterium]
MSIVSKLREQRPKQVLLISPTSSHEVARTKWLSANLGIERLAGHLKQHGHYGETYDTNLHNLLPEGMSLEEKLRERPWDIVGFSIQEDTMIADIANVQLASRICPNALLIAGGHTAQFDYQTLLDKSPVRIVVLGEGERPLLALVEGTPLDEIPGIVFKNAAIPLSRKEFKEATENIDYEGIPYETYWDYYVKLYTEGGKELTAEQSRLIHTVRIFTRNFCPMRCTFCSTINFLPEASGKRVVPMAEISGVDLVNLLKRIIKAHPRVQNFYFTDDDFCSRRNQLIEFLNLVIEEKLPVSFFAFSRIDDIDEEVAVLMKKAGFKGLHIGIENFQPEILQEINKEVNVETIDKNLAILNRHGILPSTTFILCTPNSKIEWIESTARRILEGYENGTLSPGLNVMSQPQLGSQLYEQHSDFETQNIPIPGTKHSLKRSHFVRCADPETREFQYRFLHRWGSYVEELSKSEETGHLTSPAQTPIKLRMVLDVIREIREERGKPDQFRYSGMTYEERNALWMRLQTFKYGASL